MKVKADKIRVAVSRKDSKQGRIILYNNPEEKDKTSNSTNVNMHKRINKANQRYSIFFNGSIFYDVEKCFTYIFEIAKEKDDVDELYEVLSNLEEFKYMYKKEKIKKKIDSVSVQTGDKNIYKVMYIYVGERMHIKWQNSVFHKAAAEMLCCICAKEKFSNKLNYLKKNNPNVMADFILAAKEIDIKELFIYPNTNNLERYFTSIMQSMVKKCSADVYLQDNEQEINKCIMKEIQYLLNINSITITSKETTNEIKLSDIKYMYATEERLKLVIIRMRRTLKRGTNGEIAVELLKGLAQMDGVNFSNTVKRLKDEKYKELVKFVDAVNRDYHRVSACKSLKKINVKIQPAKESDNILALASFSNPKKQALNDTLKKYASSEKDSDEVLKGIKGLLFDYFLPWDYEIRENYTSDANLWKMPYKEKYFDTNFGTNNGEDIEIQSIIAGCNGNRIPQRQIKQRIRYVNYGKYLELKEAGDSHRLYWLQYIKEYVERHYVVTNRVLTEQDCLATEMMTKCWKDIVQFICGKYIDIGKAVYHFTNVGRLPKPENNIVYGKINDEFSKGVSSFDYEIIKAEETLQRDIAISVVYATTAFSRSVIDEDKRQNENRENMEDILFIEKSKMSSLMKENAIKQLLRFFGGASSINEEIKNYLVEKDFVEEIRGQLINIRNENFHYGVAIEKNNDYGCLEKLWDNDICAYKDLVKKRYYSNNTGMFYKKEDIASLVGKLYSKENIYEAQIPAFSTILKRKDLPDFMKELNVKNDKVNESGGDFEGTLYFLLKEIYYRDFIVSDEIVNYFINAVEENLRNCDNNRKQVMKNNGKSKEFEEANNLYNAAKNFSQYIGGIKKMNYSDEVKIGTVCQMIMSEYNQQNTGKQDEEIYKHFKVLISLCMKIAFKNYINESKEYIFLLSPYNNGDKDEKVLFLENVDIKCSIEKNNYQWYTLAHFLHPKQLNLLVGDLKSYIQFRQDILRRMGYAGEGCDRDKNETLKKIDNALDILCVLEFVRSISGRVSNDFMDYYDDKEEYAQYMSYYIDYKLLEGKSAFESLKFFCQNTLDGDDIVDIYADAENPKVTRNVELARMYAGGSIVIPGYEKITASEIRNYYSEKVGVAKIMSRGAYISEEEQKKVVCLQQLKNRLTLNEVTDIFMMVNDFLGKLVSLSYLRERDEMYLLLGFYYMALQQNGESLWNDEKMRNLYSNKKNISIQDGLVLYQIACVFNFGNKLLVPENSEKIKLIGGQVATKIGKFYSCHCKSFDKAIRIFEDERNDRNIADLRNYVDHLKYYAHPDRSILDLYYGFYSMAFGYSNKLKQSVLFNFETILERYFLGRDNIGFNSKENTAGLVMHNEMKVLKFTYKLKDKKGKYIDRVLVDARSQGFANAVKRVLEYRVDNNI